MTRILQVRRGTATQNDNFTGLAGEITMDTTNKTLRVHDGSTLGGFALARQSDIEEVTPESFDINSVSAEFWTALFETYQTNNSENIHSESSTMTPLSTTAYFDKTFNCGVAPIFAEAVLVCQTPEAGYSINDEVRAFGIGDYATPMLNTYIENDEVHARLFSGGQSFWVCHKTNGTKSTITNYKWLLKIIVYY